MDTRTVLLIFTIVVGAMGHTVIDLDPDFNVMFHMASDDTIEIQVIARTTGWVGFGFSNTHSFSNADMVIGGINDTNDEIYHQDYWSTSSDVVPTLDTIQNWQRFDTVCIQNGTHTTMYYSRLLNTGDANQDLIIPNSNVYLVWAYGDTDTLGTAARQEIYHDAINFISAGSHGGSSAIHGSIATILLCVGFYVFQFC
ncbi:hypothetical protein HA402_003030 [Bradysia odoriphaga]|nr:hypothetical protein HA402_003030 [Bradysia odoriphaga]